MRKIHLIKQQQEAEKRLECFIQYLSTIDVNQKVISDLKTLTADSSSTVSMLYGMCYLNHCCSFTPRQIAKQLKVPIQLVKLLLDDLKSAIQKIDYLGAQLTQEILGNYSQLDDDSALIELTTAYFHKGFDIIRTLQLQGNDR